jgi:hypothetical protein
LDTPLSGTTLLSEDMDQILDDEDVYSFGSSVLDCWDVDLDGVSDVLIGSPHSSQGAEDAGAVFLFSGDISGFIYTSDAIGVLYDETTDVAFGHRLESFSTLSPTIPNGIAVAAPGAGLDSELLGDVYLVSAQTGSQTIRSEGVIRISGETDGPLFGISMAVASDVDGDGIDGDGIEDLIVGAFRSVEFGGEGKVYVFIGPLLGDVNAANADHAYTGETYGGFFGVVPIASTDIDGDGLGDLITGAWLDYNGPGQAVGAAYGFLGPFDGPTGAVGDAEFTIYGEEDLNGFGTEIASSDQDHDGFPDVVVGAPGSRGIGAVSYCRGPLSGTYLESDATAVIRGGREDVDFGETLLTAGDLDSDGRADLAIGVRYDETVHTQAGAVYLFFGSGW